MDTASQASETNGVMEAPTTPAGRSVLDRIVEFFRPLDEIDRHPAFEQVLWTIADALSQAAGAALTTIWVPDQQKGKLQLACSTLRQEGDLPEQLDAEHTRTGQAAATGRPCFYPDLKSIRECGSPELLERLGLTEMWCVPLLAPSLGLPHDVAAVASAHFATGTGAGRLGEAFVRFCGVRAGRVIERALWAEQDAIVQQVYRAMSGIDEGIWPVMDEVASTIARLLHFAACSILLDDHTLDVLRIIGTTGIKSNKPRQEWMYEYGQGATGRVAQEKTIIATEDVDAEEPSAAASWFPEDVDGGRARQLLAAPIRSPDGRLLGVVRLRNKHQHEGVSWTRRLNALDSLRIERVARVMAPLLSLTAEKLYQDSVLKRIRHDQKAPANMIRSFASYYAHLSPEKLAQNLESLKQGLEDCESLADLIAINAELTRIDAVSGIDLRPEYDFLLSGFVAKVCKMFRRICREKGLKGPFLDDDFHAIPKVWADPVLLQIALYNLLDNAVKYSHAGTEVRIASECVTDESGTHYYVHVDNWGVGITDGDHERVFDRQYRSAAARERAVAGLGLGLTVARAIARRHGGDLIVTSLTNPTTFTIDLPGTLARRAPT